MAVPPIPQLGSSGSVSVPSHSASKLVIFGKQALASLFKSRFQKKKLLR